MRKIFVTGIGTDVGKTIVAAILTEAFNADYWKPVQTGNSIDSDTLKVKSLISNNITNYHTEVYSLKQPVSPHAAAAQEGVTIRLENINIPQSSNNIIVIEGAGGLMVPLNDSEFIVDMIRKFDAEVVLVVKSYLGCINHTLLSIDCLMQRNCNILGIVFNGSPDKHTKDIILKYSKCREILELETENEISKKTIIKYSQKIKQFSVV